MVSIKKECLLIKPEDMKPSSSKMEVLGVLNPAGTRLSDGTILLYVRVLERLKNHEDEKYRYSPRLVGKNKYELKIDRFSKKKIVDQSEMDFLFKDGTKRLTFISHFRRVFLDESGFNVLSVDEKPSFYGLKSDGELGVEDPRITSIDGKYVMTYVTLSRNQNISTNIAFSQDCINWQRKGIVFGEQDKDVVIFPEKIKGEYVAFDRPESNFQFTPPHIWIAYSQDLLHWGELKSVILSKKKDLDYGRNGAGPPPIRTDDGWLFIYHKVKEDETVSEIKSLKCSVKKLLNIPDDSCIEREVKIDYLVGAALLDLKNPRKVLAKSSESLFYPLKDYEKGTFENKSVIFPTCAILDLNQEDLLIYSGAGDRVVSLKEISIKDILDSLKKV